METIAPGRSSFLGLVRALTGDTKTFLRQEIQLAKTEISEKISRFGKNATALAVGGLIAYAGLIVSLAGLGCLIGWLLERADLAPMLGAFIGLGGIGLLVVVIGCIFLFKGLRSISRESLAPEKTIYTLQELKGAPDPYAKQWSENPGSKPSSEEIQAKVEATENRMGDTLDELGRRLSPSHINAQVKYRIKMHPYRSGFIAMAAGILSGLLLKRKLRQA